MLPSVEEVDLKTNIPEPLPSASNTPIESKVITPSINVESALLLTPLELLMLISLKKLIPVPLIDWALDPIKVNNPL